MSGGIMVYFRIHYHRCVGCGGAFECFCECPGSVVDYLCEDCQEDESLS